MARHYNDAREPAKANDEVASMPAMPGPGIGSAPPKA